MISHDISKIYELQNVITPKNVHIFSLFGPEFLAPTFPSYAVDLGASPRPLSALQVAPGDCEHRIAGKCPLKYHPLKKRIVWGY